MAKALAILQRMDEMMDAALRAPGGLKESALRALGSALCHAQGVLMDHHRNSIEPSLVEACSHARTLKEGANAMHNPLFPMRM